MASRAVSLTFHSDDMSAERPWCASEVRVWRRKMGYFAIIFVIVDFSTFGNFEGNNHKNRAAVTLASYKFRRCAIFGAG